MSDEEAKKKIADQIAQISEQYDFVVGGIQQMLRTFADGVSRVARHYERDAWAREWVEIVQRAAADLRLAETKVQIQPLAPHGEVPS
jgi:Trm5-related predicted tRNA methylase